MVYETPEVCSLVLSVMTVFVAVSSSARKIVSPVMLKLEAFAELSASDSLKRMEMLLSPTDGWICKTVGAAGVPLERGSPLWLCAGKAVMACKPRSVTRIRCFSAFMDGIEGIGSADCWVNASLEPFVNTHERTIRS